MLSYFKHFSKIIVAQNTTEAVFNAVPSLTAVMYFSDFPLNVDNQPPTFTVADIVNKLVTVADLEKVNDYLNTDGLIYHESCINTPAPTLIAFRSYDSTMFINANLDELDIHFNSDDTLVVMFLTPNGLPCSFEVYATLINVIKDLIV